jgi:hypothetical protein
MNLVERKFYSKKKQFFSELLSKLGVDIVRISYKFIADLKRIAELNTKMTEYNELGWLMKLRKEREKLIPEVVNKKKKSELSENQEKWHSRNG